MGTGKIRLEGLRIIKQARMAFLEGERKAMENLKNDLVRRIKMLEYSLKQERFNLVLIQIEARGIPIIF